MPNTITRRPAAAGALLCSAILLTFTAATTTSSRAATFLAGDVTTWLGSGSGAGISEAVLIIQWPGQEAWAWGYRWETASTRDGRDLLLALAGADPRFSFTGGSFVSDLRWDADLDGTPELTMPAFDPGTGAYLQYFVNNAQQEGNYNNGPAPGGAHLLPPLGSPYDEAGPGAWHSSNTGVLGRPVVDGSWDGWVYSNGASPGLPVNAPAPIPEPASAALLAAVGSLLLRRKR